MQVSGKYLDFTGLVDTRSPMGNVGTLLLDPTNIWIATTLGSAQGAGMPGSDTEVDALGAPVATYFASSAIDDSFLSTGNLISSLSSNDVIVTTTNASGSGAGNITLVDQLDFNGIGTHQLTLSAENDIFINAAIQDTVAGGDTLNTSISRGNCTG